MLPRRTSWRRKAYQYRTWLLPIDLAYPGYYHETMSLDQALEPLTFAYGLVLGALRRRANGLMAPFIVHMLTDLVIVTIVLALVRA